MGLVLVKGNPMTKRQLGLLFISLGILLAVALFAADLLGASQFGGIGPMQRLALAGAIVLTIVGITLLPLGDRPA